MAGQFRHVTVSRAHRARQHEYEFARNAFRAFRPGPDEEAKREREIAALPVVIWRGRTLHTIRCLGEFGRGPHDVNVTDALLWQLIDLNHYRCPFHS